MSSVDTLRSVSIHRALNRSDLYLFWGCDRELVMTAGLMAGTSVFIGMTISAFIFGVVFWLFVVFALRIMAKVDPQLRHVYMRHRRYQAYYAARSTPFVFSGKFAESREGNPWERK